MSIDMEKLEFTYNWNNKLQCRMFTTIRLAGQKYKDGDVVAVYLKGEYLFDATIIEIRLMKLHQINNFIAGLDTGYDKDQCTGIIQTMYKNKQIDWTRQNLAFILLKKCNDENKD